MAKLKFRINHILLLLYSLILCIPLYSQKSPLDLLSVDSLSVEKKKEAFVALTQSISEKQASVTILACDSALKNLGKLKPYSDHIKFLKAVCFTRLKKFNEALELLKAIDTKQDLEFENSLNEVIGKTYLVMSNYNSSLDYQFKVLNYATTIKPNISKQVSTLTNITTVYYRSKLFSKAYEYTKKCIAIAEKSNEPKLLYQAYSNLGIYYLEKQELAKADSVYTKVLTYVPSLSSRGKISFYNNYAETKRLLKDYTQSKIYIDSCYQLALAEKDTFWTAIALVNKGNLNIAENKPAVAIKECALALKYAMRFKNIVWQKNSCGCLYDAYTKLNDHKNALIYFKKTTELTDSISNEKSRNEATQKDLQYKYAVKAAADSVKQLEANKVKDAQILAQQSQLNEEKIVRVSLFIVAALILIFAGFVYNRFKISQKQKKIIEEQQILTESQKELLQIKQKEIIDSINYAKRIQYTLLANSEFLNANLPSYFIYFNPKDIVSGDFYWAAKKDHLLYLAVCDSTGHGVPGAFMSLLSIGFLNEAISQQNIKEPNKILDHVRQKLIESISKDGQQDGFDGILLCIDQQSNEISYAAANNSPLLISNNTLSVLPSDRMPVGKGEKKDAFSVFSISVKKGDHLYLYTDGFADQFGGSKGKKYKYKALNEFLQRNSIQSSNEQKQLLQLEFENWKGQLEQVDDVCILGIRL